MKRIAIAELEGAALDWAVAMAVCPESFRDSRRHDGTPNWVAGWLDNGSPSTDWSQCGPLIERYKVGIEQTREEAYAYTPEEPLCGFFDHRPLVAICRAIVAAHNPDGFEEVPDKLIQETGA